VARFLLQTPEMSSVVKSFAGLELQRRRVNGRDPGFLASRGLVLNS
jgi:hypothetical protein